MTALAEQPSLLDKAYGTISPIAHMEARDYQEAIALYYATEATNRPWADWPDDSATTLRETYRRVAEWRDTTATWTDDGAAHDRWDRLWWGLGQFVTELNSARSTS